jgi:VanZ family protein
MTAPRRFPPWLPPLAWAGVILAASSMQDLQTTTGGIEIRDKLAHFGEYFVFGWLVARCFDTQGWPARKHFFWTIAFGVGMGLLDEFYQGYVPGRERDLLDLTADAIGTFAGWYYSREDRAVGTADGATRNA